MKQIIKNFKAYISNKQVSVVSVVISTISMLVIMWMVVSWLNVAIHNKTPNYNYPKWNLFCLLVKDNDDSTLQEVNTNKSEKADRECVPIEEPVVLPDTVQKQEVVDDSIYYDVPLTHSQQDYLFNVCDEYGVNKELVISVMYAESNFTVDTISSTNDYGIMQINKCNHKHLSNVLGVTDFLSYEQNVHAGCYMLSQYTNRYTTDEQILLCYHLGEGGAQKYIKSNNTQTAYTQKIIEYKNSIHKN